MPQVLDQTTDTSYRDLYHYSKLYAFPEYVKTAEPSEVLDKDALKDVPSRLFADVARRRFPGNTKAATWLSWLYFVEKKAELHPKIADWIEDRLRYFAEYHGITKDVDELRTKYAELHNDDISRLPDSSFALVTGDGPSRERRYPLRNALEVKAAANWFVDHRHRFEFDERRQIASKITEKIAEFGASVPGETALVLERHVFRGTYDPKQAGLQLRNRVKAASRNVDDVMRLGLLKLAEEVENNPRLALDYDTRVGLCRTLSVFDETTGLSRQYDSRLPMPEDIFGQASVKLASEFVKSAVELANGRIYEQEQFEKVALHDIRSLFGDETAKTVATGLLVDPAKMAAWAGNLSRRDAETVSKLMDSAGEKPFGKTAASAGNVRDLIWQFADVK